MHTFKRQLEGSVYSHFWPNCSFCSPHTFNILHFISSPSKIKHYSVLNFRKFVCLVEK